MFTWKMGHTVFKMTKQPKVNIGWEPRLCTLILMINNKSNLVFPLLVFSNKAYLSFPLDRDLAPWLDDVSADLVERVLAARRDVYLERLAGRLHARGRVHRVAEQAVARHGQTYYTRYHRTCDVGKWSVKYVKINIVCYEYVEMQLFNAAGRWRLCCGVSRNSRICFVYF